MPQQNSKDLLDSNWCPQKSDVVENEVEDDVILYDPRSGDAVCLNLSAGLVWDLCDGTREIASITEDMARMFQMPSEELVHDVRAILKQLCDRNLIH